MPLGLLGLCEDDPPFWICVGERDQGGEGTGAAHHVAVTLLLPVPTEEEEKPLT